jgi:hypothetical protein
MEKIIKISATSPNKTAATYCQAITKSVPITPASNAVWFAGAQISGIK